MSSKKPAFTASAWFRYPEFLSFLDGQDDGPFYWVDTGPIPGVYLFAHSDVPPTSAGPTLHLDRQVIYIGKSLGLRGRLSYHQRLKGGVNSYPFLFNDFKMRKLYLSAFISDDLFHVATRTRANKLLHDFEREKLADYVKMFGAKPSMNERVGKARR